MSLIRVAALALAVALAAPQLAAAQAAPKIAVIDVQGIISESETGKQVLEGLGTFQKEQQAKLDARRTEIEDLRTRISDGQLSLAEDKLAELEKELEEKVIAAKRATDDANRELAKRQEQALKDIERRVMPIIQQIGLEGGYTMIFRKFDSGLVYADSEVDITQAVIARLDAASAAPAN